MITHISHYREQIALSNHTKNKLMREASIKFWKPVDLCLMQCVCAEEGKLPQFSSRSICSFILLMVGCTLEFVEIWILGISLFSIYRLFYPVHIPFTRVALHLYTYMCVCACTHARVYMCNACILILAKQSLAILISHHIAPLYGMPKQSLKHQLHYVSILLKNSSNLFIFHLQMAQHD